MQELRTVIGAAVRIGENRARIEQGRKVLARTALPHGRKERSIDMGTIGDIAAHASQKGLSPGHVVRLRDYLFHEARRPDANPEEFILTFNRARAAAKGLVFDQCASPRLTWDVFSEICAALARNSGRARITRAELAQLCRVRPEQVSRATAQLCATQPPLLRRHEDGRGVVYEVVPPPEAGFPTWHGDRASRLDAQGEAWADAQLELAVGQ